MDLGCSTRQGQMTRFVFLARYVFDQGKSLSRNRWLVRFISSHLARRLKGFRPDNYVISYPKSGRTWLRMILMSYYSQARNLNEISWSVLENITGKTIVFDHADGTWRPMPKRIERMKISSKFSSKRVVLLVRDPRDALVSNWYHLSFRYKIYKRSLSQFIRERLLGVEKIIHFMNLWVNQRELFEDLLIIRYEDMALDTQAALRKILTFTGEKQIDTERLRNAIDAVSFKNMQRMEALGQRNPFAVPSNLHDERSFKCRKGIVGQWKSHFSQTDIVFLDEEISNRLWKGFGYTNSIGTQERHHDGEDIDFESQFLQSRPRAPQWDPSTLGSGGIT